VRVVAGGYDPSLAPDEYEPPGAGIDFLVRGEGDLTSAISSPRSSTMTAAAPAIQGLSVHDGCRFRHNPPRQVNSLDDGTVERPARAARVLSGYTFLGRQVDIVETSRGCHLRLQLLLDRRDARTQLPHVRLRARPRGHRRRAGPRRAGRSSSSTTTSC
jgi:radical SAM superfamily enzyme YgiQ (UPF0313 family)